MNQRPSPRPTQDFIIHSFARSCDILRRFADARCDVPPEGQVRTRFWIYLDFLQSHGFTTRVIAAHEAAVDASTVLRNSDVTDTGFRFIQAIEKKWSGGLGKSRDPAKDRALLARWLASFQSENT